MITWIPVRGEGYWRNGRLVGRGLYANELICRLEKGAFTSAGKLTGAGIVVNYAETLVYIRTGNFVEGKEEGNIIEYVFSQTDWENLKDNEIIEATRYEHIFSAGSWSSTSSTETVDIEGEIVYTNRWRSFGFAEL
jgi:hypothetical protein